VVKVVTNKYDQAFYISRALIPYPYKESSQEYYHIIGAMVMRSERESPGNNPQPARTYEYYQGV